MMKWVWIFLLPFAVWGHETVIESNEAFYNGRTITLTGDVSVENAMGRVTAEKAVLTRDETGATKIDFPWIELTQAVTVTLPDKSRLNCERVFLDHTKMSSHFTGSPQVSYLDERGEVWADEAFVDYIDAEGSIKPTKVRLVGNVKLVFLENGQYALADLVTYYPDQQLMTLEGVEGRRVLFFDKERNMQLSARQVRASRNPETKKDSIQGVGDVRFVFGQDELAKFKERFKW
jgi:lipopolysaccharide export system protein LptA